MTTNTTPDAITTLRAMYRALRATGERPDVDAYVNAILDAAADGADTARILRAFEALGYTVRLDILGQNAGAGSRVLAAKTSRGWQGAIRVASLFGLSDVWAAAMTAHYGPTGTHESRRGADGVPTLDTLTEFPQIGTRMAEAAERFETLCAWHDRHNTGNHHPITGRPLAA